MKLRIKRVDIKANTKNTYWYLHETILRREVNLPSNESAVLTQVTSTLHLSSYFHINAGVH